MTRQDEVLFGTISYITLLGWIIAILAARDKRSYFITFHLRQSLGINLTLMCFAWIPVVGWILGVFLFIFWIIAIFGAIQHRTEPVPLFGDFYQRLFSGIQ